LLKKCDDIGVETASQPELSPIDTDCAVLTGMIHLQNPCDCQPMSRIHVSIQTDVGDHRSLVKREINPALSGATGYRFPRLLEISKQ
jgi:hypothetical protein